MDYVIYPNIQFLKDEESNMNNGDGSTYRLFDEEEDKQELYLQAITIPKS